MRFIFINIYCVTVLLVTCVFVDHLKASISEEVKSPEKEIMLKIQINKHTFIARLADNVTTQAFIKKLPMTIQMDDYSRNEKCYNLPERLPTHSVNPHHIQAGELMLFGSSTLVLFYESFSTPYSYTKLGRIENIRGLKSALGTGQVTVSFSRIP